MRTATFYNYVITENGEIYGSTGRLLKVRLHKGRYEIGISTPKGKKIYPLARIIYKAFNPDFDITDKNLCVSFKDNNKLNIHIDNLICIFRGDLIQGDRHRNRVKITQKQTEQIKKEYHKTIDNRPINQFDNKSVYNSYRSLAKKYGVTFSLIKQIIEGKTRDKSKYKLKRG